MPDGGMVTPQLLGHAKAADLPAEAADPSAEAALPLEEVATPGTTTIASLCILLLACAAQPATIASNSA